MTITSLILLLPQSLAATIVVAQDGSGDALTVTEGAAMLDHGDTLHIREGHYDEPEGRLRVNRGGHSHLRDISISGEGVGRSIVSFVGESVIYISFVGDLAVSDLTFMFAENGGLVFESDSEEGVAIVSDVEILGGGESSYGGQIVFPDRGVFLLSRSVFADAPDVSLYGTGGTLDLTIDRMNRPALPSRPINRAPRCPESPRLLPLQRPLPRPLLPPRRWPVRPGGRVG